LFVSFFFIAVLGIELRALCMLGKHSTSELYLHPLSFFYQLATNIRDMLYTHQYRTDEFHYFTFVPSFPLWGTVTHACNPSSVRGGDRRIVVQGSKKVGPAW
jgi:hypothetical protein